MGDDNRSIFGFVVVAFLVVLTGPALQAAYADATTSVSVYDEELAVDYNSSVAVAQNTTDYYSDDVHVETANGTVLDEGGDYAWSAANGEVTFFDTSATSSGDTVTIDYDYRARTQATENVWSILGGLYSVLGVFVLVAAIRALMAYLSGDKNPLNRGLRP